MLYVVYDERTNNIHTFNRRFLFIFFVPILEWNVLIQFV